MFKKTIFPNGLRLITVPNKSAQSAAVFVFCGAGSRHERAAINGVSHFIEHLMFKGTKKRPTTLDISKELDSVGAEFNAMTSKDWTGYYVKINSRQLDLALDVLSDMLYHSKFDAREINKERGVIIEEINMYHDNPIMYIEDLLEQLIFQGSTLGWEIAGPREVIAKIPRAEILQYKNQHYRAEKMVIVVAGNFQTAQISTKIKKYFKTQSPRPPAAPEVSKFEFDNFCFTQNQPRVIIKHKKTTQVQLGLGFPGYGFFDDRNYAHYLLSLILGGTMSSRLFIAVREKLGLAYSIHAYPNVYQDVGDLVIFAGLDKTRLEQAIRVIMRELRAVKQQGVTAAELKQAKEYFQGKTILRLEDTSRLADWYGKQELLENKIMTPEQKIERFNQVTLAQIKQAANDIFQPRFINLAIIGPYHDSKYFEPMLEV